MTAAQWLTSASGMENGERGNPGDDAYGVTGHDSPGPSSDVTCDY